MTAEKYVREVGKLLKCRTAKKREIKKQLLEEINSAVGKGQSLDEVLGRMGIPWDFANHYNDQFDKEEKKAAKREKTWKVWGIILSFLLIIAIAAYWKLPKFSDIGESSVFDETQVRAQAEEIIRFYSEDNFHSVTERMDENMKTVINAATLQYMKTQVSEDFGELVSFDEMDTAEAVQDGKNYAMVQVQVSYENVSVFYTITFDEELKLAGFYIK